MAGEMAMWGAQSSTDECSLTFSRLCPSALPRSRRCPLGYLRINSRDYVRDRQQGSLCMYTESAGE